MKQHLDHPDASRGYGIVGWAGLLVFTPTLAWILLTHPERTLVTDVAMAVQVASMAIIFFRLIQRARAGRELPLVPRNGFFLITFWLAVAGQMIAYFTV